MASSVMFSFIVCPYCKAGSILSPIAVAGCHSLVVLFGQKRASQNGVVHDYSAVSPMSGTTFLGRYCCLLIASRA